jgi:hypothetical protein
MAFAIVHADVVDSATALSRAKLVARLDVTVNN